MSTDILDQSPLYREWIETAEARGEEKGNMEGMRDAVRLMLASRFGPLASDLAAAIDSADNATLSVVITHLATDPITEIRVRLGLGSKPA